MNKPDCDFLELCSDWGELKGVVVRFERRAVIGNWCAILMFHDTNGYYFSPPVYWVAQGRKQESMEEKRNRVYSQLNNAAAKAHANRIQSNIGRPAAAKRA